MPSQRLPWRIVLPFAGLVLAGSVALLAWMAWMIGLEDRARFEQLAQTNASFINQTGFPPTERMARQLGEVLSVAVHFRRQGKVIPEPLEPHSETELLSAAGTGRCQRLGGAEVVAVPLDAGGEMILSRPAFASWRNVWRPQTFAILGAFWLLALGVAWMISRGLVLPLRNLASRLPEIETSGPLDLPEAERKDEIGDVARAFLRTREALQQERSKREQAEKLAVLGRMTAALAHEIQNPVSAIKMHAQLAAMDGDHPSSSIIATEAERIENLVNQWMFLSRPEPPALADVEVRPLVAGVVAAHSAQLTHAQVAAHEEVPPDLWVKADRRRVTQVFSNLLINAAQAMPRGGAVVVSAQAKGAEIEVQFVDEGRGFSSQALERFAEFFYTEKEGGMGIGLSVASEIVKAHGGSLRVDNRDGGGACVTVRLPAGTRPPS